MAFGDGLSADFNWDLIRGIDWDAVAANDAVTTSAPGDYQDYQDDHAEWVAGGQVGPAPREEDYTAPDPGAPSSSGDPVADAEQEAIYRDGEELLRAKLAEYGLGALEEWAFEQLREDFSVDTIILRLRDQDAYKERFVGMDLRRSNGLNAINETDYLALERSYQQTAAAAGLPVGFYDDPSDFAAFIGNDVSAAEYTDRVAMAATAIQNINPELKNQLAELYGIGVKDDGELIAYYLDPERGVSVIEQRLQLEAAGLSGAGVQVLGQGFTRPFAERLSDLNVQQREISDRLGRQSGLVQTKLLGEKRGLTATEVAASEFGLDPDSVAQVRSLRQRRQESARRASGAMASNAGISGLGSSGSLT